MLARCSERALAGEGQFVLVVGEPGIGKSRLVEEFRGQLADRRHSWVEWSASQLLQNTPLYPILGWGRVRFGGPEVAPERRLAELESLLADVKLDATKLAPLLASMVGIPAIPPGLHAKSFAGGNSSRSVGRYGPVGDRQRSPKPAARSRP